MDNCWVSSYHVATLRSSIGLHLKERMTDLERFSMHGHSYSRWSPPTDFLGGPGVLRVCTPFFFFTPTSSHILIPLLAPYLLLAVHNWNTHTLKPGLQVFSCSHFFIELRALSAFHSEDNNVLKICMVITPPLGCTVPNVWFWQVKGTSSSVSQRRE